MVERKYLSEIDWLMEDWDWKRNSQEEIYPNEISTGSDKYAWWKCHICGYEENKRCNNRYYGHGCTKCSRKRIGKKVTENYINKNGSFGEQYPILAYEWHKIKNGEITPFDVNKGSSKKVWWQCVNNHEYQAAISHRVNGTGCPYCAGRKVLVGYNDFETIYPELAKEWDYEKNEKCTPKQITAGSSKKVWWRCDKGHSYNSTVANRVIGQGCSICSGKKVLVGYNDLQSILPEVALDWDTKKNKELLPSQITIGSNKKIWWKCHVCGYEWKQHVYTRQKCGCPACANRVLVIGYNDLQTKYPEIAKEWHPRIKWRNKVKRYNLWNE